jgi:hypothetical protein
MARMARIDSSTPEGEAHLMALNEARQVQIHEFDLVKRGGVIILVAIIAAQLVSVVSGYGY